MKLCSPQFNLITQVNDEIMYQQAQVEGVAFFQWYQWVEKTLQKEILQQLIKTKSKNPPPEDKKRKSTSKKTLTQKQKEQLKGDIKQVVSGKPAPKTDKSKPALMRAQTGVMTFAPSFK